MHEFFSPFQLNLGTVVFNLLYGNVYLGQGMGTNTTIVGFCSVASLRILTFAINVLRFPVRTTSRCRADSFRTTAPNLSLRLLENSSLSTSIATRLP
jgi:hypothetical protein